MAIAYAKLALCSALPTLWELIFEFDSCGAILTIARLSLACGRGGSPFLLRAREEYWITVNRELALLCDVRSPSSDSIHSLGFSIDSDGNLSDHGPSYYMNALGWER